jgi:hypothetical protein
MHALGIREGREIKRGWSKERARWRMTGFMMVYASCLESRLGAAERESIIGLVRPATDQLSLHQGAELALSQTELADPVSEDTGRLSFVGAGCRQDETHFEDYRVDKHGRKTSDADRRRKEVEGWETTLLDHLHGFNVRFARHEKAPVNGLAESSKAISEVPSKSLSVFNA